MSKKTKNKASQHERYRAARRRLRTVLRPYWNRQTFEGNWNVALVFDAQGADQSDTFPLNDLFRLINHHCPPGGDDRATEGRIQGMHRALTEIGRVVYGPEYTPSPGEPTARQITRLAGTIDAKIEQPRGEYRSQILDSVLSTLGVPLNENTDQLTTVEQTVAAIRSYYTTQPQGEAIREARAAERANILGMLGITVNPGAGPGTAGAVAQIRNWADEQVRKARFYRTPRWSQQEITAEQLNAFQDQVADLAKERMDERAETAEANAVQNTLGALLADLTGEAIFPPADTEKHTIKSTVEFIKHRTDQRVRGAQWAARESLTADLAYRINYLTGGSPFSEQDMSDAQHMALAIDRRYTRMQADANDQ